MSWINDVKIQLAGLDTSARSLRKFAFTVGGLLSVLGIYLLWRFPTGWKGQVLVGVGVLLIIGGLVFPVHLKRLYQVWMGLAFAIGWLVSHGILILFYYLFFTPTAIIIRMSGKELLDINFSRRKESYWIRRDSSQTVDYEKMH